MLKTEVLHWFIIDCNDFKSEYMDCLKLAFNLTTVKDRIDINLTTKSKTKYVSKCKCGFWYSILDPLKNFTECFI